VSLKEALAEPLPSPVPLMQVINNECIKDKYFLRGLGQKIAGMVFCAFSAPTGMGPVQSGLEGNEAKQQVARQRAGLTVRGKKDENQVPVAEGRAGRKARRSNVCFSTTGKNRLRR
jgi:hypothetical protein